MTMFVKNRSIAITGHTSGLGAALYEYLNRVKSPVDYTCTGFSRSNGYDITDPGTLITSMKLIGDFDIFINCAYDGFGQVDLLYALYNEWRNSNKLIINISSNSGDGIKDKIHPYAIHKAALDKASEQCFYDKGKCQVLNLRPGWIDVPRVQEIKTEKINPHDIAKIIHLFITQLYAADIGLATSYIVKELTILPRPKL